MKAVLFFCTGLVAGAQTASLSNLSTRARVGPAGDVLVAGFNVGPGTNKTILVRAIGPSLTGFGVPGALADPRLELYAGAEKIAENDNWSTRIGNATPVTPGSFATVGAFGLAAGSRDAALIVHLPPGSYTAQVSGVGNASGVALVEVYEVGPVRARITNLSTRANVSPGGDVLIPGLVIAPGGGTRRLLVRAAGPSLQTFGIPGTLADPAITIMGPGGRIIAANDNWDTPVTAPSLSAAFRQAGAFEFAAGSRDAAVIGDLVPGDYTIQVSGAGDTGGVTLVEVYDLSPSTREVDASAPLRLESVYGRYQRLPIQNNFHEGTISVKEVASDTVVLQWMNDARVSWNLHPALAVGRLLTDSTNPTQETAAPDFHLSIQGGEVVGFMYRSDFFVREGASVLPQQSNGLHGYINSQVQPPPASHGYGFSFYSTIWPLLEKPLSGFQMGLAGTWIRPNNDGFPEPLLPPNHKNRGTTLFQTIEGGLGFWQSTRFGTSTAKYRINGTPDGYNTEISSPGWGFGATASLPAEKMGIAQLSNRLLIPPDGFTFREGSNGQVLGNAWMALPLTQPKIAFAVPVGEHSWTLFLNAANFRGPVAFWIPDVWTVLSRSYPVIQGRGHDALAALMRGGALEVNTVPKFESTDSSGLVYSRIPALRFPVDAGGITYLMQDVAMYSADTLFSAVKTWLNGGNAVSGRFDSRGAFRPRLTPNPITLDQGGVVVTGIDQFVQTIVLDTPGSSAFALKWPNPTSAGAFPEFFERSSGMIRAVTAGQVPPATGLTLPTSFRSASLGPNYTSPAGGTNAWNTPGPRAGPFQVQLSDGSVVTYSWYRFADQPSLQGLNWTDAEKQRLQTVVERIHSTWTPAGEYLPPPSRGVLAELDTALVVTPPSGLEVGFVPIVTRQGLP